MVERPSSRWLAGESDIELAGSLSFELVSSSSSSSSRSPRMIGSSYELLPWDFAGEAEMLRRLVFRTWDEGGESSMTTGVRGVWPILSPRMRLESSTPPEADFWILSTSKKRREKGDVEGEALVDMLGPADLRPVAMMSRLSGCAVTWNHMQYAIVV